MLISRWVQSRPVMGRCLPALDLLADRSAEVANILITDSDHWLWWSHDWSWWLVQVAALDTSTRASNSSLVFDDSPTGKYSILSWHFKKTCNSRSSIAVHVGSGSDGIEQSARSQNARWQVARWSRCVLVVFAPRFVCCCCLFLLFFLLSLLVVVSGYFLVVLLLFLFVVVHCCTGVHNCCWKLGCF